MSSSNHTPRIFDLPLGEVTGTQYFGFRYGNMIVRGDGNIFFDHSYLMMQGLYLYDSARAKKRWKNIEIFIEYMRVAENNPPSYAGLGIGTRSIHEMQRDNPKVPTYYLKHTFDGKRLIYCS